MSIKEIYIKDRPREKIARLGAKKLSNQELIALLLGAGNKYNDVTKMAEDIYAYLQHTENGQANFEGLITISGVSSAKAASVMAALELGKRMAETNDKYKYYLSPSDFLPLFEDIKSMKKETLLALYLDARNQLIDKEVISIGTINGSLIHPREIFEPAIKNLSSSLVIAHNHPSGQVEPSSADIDITKKIAQSGQLLGINLIDHIIVAKDDYYSFADHNLI